jgi:hypothetical protein
MQGHAICPFCDRPVMEGGVEFGGSVLHDECYDKLQHEMHSFDGQVEEGREADLAPPVEVELIPF